MWGFLSERSKGLLPKAPDPPAQAWPQALTPLWFLILMSHLHGGQLSGRMTNCCPSLISFVVKRPLIHDCLAEAALRETQLKQDRQASLAEEQSALAATCLLRNW